MVQYNQASPRRGEKHDMLRNIVIINYIIMIISLRGNNKVILNTVNQYKSDKYMMHLLGLKKYKESQKFEQSYVFMLLPFFPFFHMP